MANIYYFCYRGKYRNIEETHLIQHFTGSQTQYAYEPQKELVKNSDHHTLVPEMLSGSKFNEHPMESEAVC